jgi:hypothetical protein
MTGDPKTPARNLKMTRVTMFGDSPAPKTNREKIVRLHRYKIRRPKVSAKGKLMIGPIANPRI